MSHVLRCVLDAKNNQTACIWDILNNLKPSKSEAQARMLKYLVSITSDERTRRVFESSHEPELALVACIWLDDQMRQHTAELAQDITNFKQFGRVSFGSFMLSAEVAGYPPGGHMIAEFHLRAPTTFIYGEPEYRHICRDVIREFAEKLSSSMAIFFYDYGEIENIYVNKFAFYEYGEEKSKPIQDFYDSIQSVGISCDWDTPYTNKAQGFDLRAYFVDRYQAL